MLIFQSEDGLHFDIPRAPAIERMLRIVSVLEAFCYYEGTSFQQIIEQARAIRAKYATYEINRHRHEWSGEELALGFVGDVGDLLKLIQAKEGIRSADNVDEALVHELSDCLWSVIVPADRYGVDLEKPFVKTMSELDSDLANYSRS